MVIIKKLFFSLFFCAILYAQEPRGISYQGVVLNPLVELPGIDSKVTPYSEENVCFRFSIYDNTNTLEYSETHNTVTDYYGQVNLVIGRGDNPLIPGRLDNIRWDGTTKFLQVEIDYSASCTDWEKISCDELNYVPFAFFALNSGSANAGNQNLIAGTKPGEIEISGGNTVIINIDDVDSDPTNEIQTIVSADTGNLVTTGTDGGALLIKADLEEVLDLHDAADVTITTPAENEILAYESGEWVNKPLKDLKIVNYASSFPAAPPTNPLIVGLPSSTNSGLSRFINIDDIDIIVMDNSSDNSYIVLEDLTLVYEGKIVKIVEGVNQNPKVSANSTGFYDTSSPDDKNNLFFNNIKIFTASGDLKVEFRHESVEFIW
jgi:hypothetical protein